MQSQRNSVTSFDAEALIFKLTGVRLTDVDGLGSSTVLAVLSETGADLASRFPSEKHFAAWTTLAPRKHQSGKRTRFPAQTASRVARAFRLAARGLINGQSVPTRCSFAHITYSGTTDTCGPSSGVSSSRTDNVIARPADGPTPGGRARWSR